MVWTTSGNTWSGVDIVRARKRWQADPQLWHRVLKPASLSINITATGLNHSKMKWWAIYTNLPVNVICIYIYIYIHIYIYIKYIYIYRQKKKLSKQCSTFILNTLIQSNYLIASLPVMYPGAVVCCCCFCMLLVFVCLCISFRNSNMISISTVEFRYYVVIIILVSLWKS